MAVHKFIKDLKEGEVIDAVYLVREKSFKPAKNGSYYIHLELSDKTGVIKGNRWDSPKELFDSFQQDDFIKIEGKVEVYNSYLQLNIKNIDRAEDPSVDISYYIPTISKNIDKMFDSLLAELKDIDSPYLKDLLDNIFSNEAIKSTFKKSPAATDFHHSYIGGLLEHTLSCMQLAKFTADNYQGIDRNLLLSGTALHDIGKTAELSYSRSFYYTDTGRLIGHLVLGANIVDKEIDRIEGFPEDLRNLLLHMILSHHGEYEWGSPKRPMCLEAIMLHNIDNLDAKANGFQHFVMTYNNDASPWTKYSKMFGEMLYKHNRR